MLTSGAQQVQTFRTNLPVTMNSNYLLYLPENIMILRFQTKIDCLVRCKMRHAETDTKALYGRL